MDSVTINLELRRARVVAVGGKKIDLDFVNGSFRRARVPFRDTALREADF